MIDKKYLLNDSQVQRFVTNGYVQVKTELDQEVHRAAHEKTQKAFGPIHDFETDRQFNPGNNVLPIVPELGQVLNDPNVVGALTSLYGKNYVVHPHRHCHPNFPVEQHEPRTTIMGVHKDGHADGNAKPRSRHPRWALLFYNPHPCPEQLGPTCITPGSHYYHRILKHGERERNVVVKKDNGRFLLPDNYVDKNFLPVVSELGTVSILHFDTVHSVITNIGDMHRYAHKFVIMRTETPESPSWNSSNTLWNQKDLGNLQNHEIMWTYMWNWMNGRNNLFESARSADADINLLVKQLDSDDVSKRLSAANELGFAGAKSADAVPGLVRCLHDPADSVRLNAAYALGAVGHAAVGPLVEAMAGEGDFFHGHAILNVSEAAHALIAAGSAAVEALTDNLTSKQEHMRAWSAFALGEIGNAASGSISGLFSALKDESQAVRRHAISALGIIGNVASDTEQALLSVFAGNEEDDLRIYALQGLIRLNAGSADTLKALKDSLNDPHPYISAFSSELLFRVGELEDHASLLEYLRPLRWFPYAKRRERVY